MQRYAHRGHTERKAVKVVKQVRGLFHRTYTDHRKSHFPHFPSHSTLDLRVPLRRATYALICAGTSASLRPRAHCCHCAALSRVAAVALAVRWAIVVATMPRM
jgi:hypothetical protein